MASDERDFRLRLPTRWPRWARSAMLHALSLARVALLAATDRVATSVRLEHELALLREELRIEDARLERVPPHRRPHYPAVERLAILELRAARNWSAAQTAERFFVTEATVGCWMVWLDEEGPSALVRSPEPVNKSPDLLAHIVRRLKVLCPAMGTAHRGRALPRRPSSRPHHCPPNDEASAPRRRTRRDGPERALHPVVVPESHLVGRPDHRAEARRLLDLVAALVGPPTLAVLLPGRRRRRPLLAPDHGRPSLPGPAPRRGDQRFSRRHDPHRRARATAPDHGPREAVHSAGIPARLPSRRGPATLRHDRKARQRCARRAPHPDAQGGRRAALACADPVAHRGERVVALR